MHEAAVKAGVERFNATLVGGNVLGLQVAPVIKRIAGRSAGGRSRTLRMKAAKPAASCTRVAESKYPA